MTPTGSAGSADLASCGNNLFRVKSSWSCATENGLENTLVTMKDSHNDIDPTNLISVETCVLLRKNNESNQPEDFDEESKCSISVEATGNAVIDRLCIVSEARMVEVHGPCDEYLNTVRAEFLLQMDETHVYSGDIKLEHPTNYLLLKLNRSSRESDLWIYGLVVHWKDDLSLSQGSASAENGVQHPPFNLEAVDRRLTQMGQDLSLNAQQCKQFLEMCSLIGRDARGDGQMKKPPLASILQGSQKKNSETSPSSSNSECYIDQKFVQLENRMIAAIEQRFEDMEKRQQALINNGIEKIMQHLEAISGLSLRESDSGGRQAADKTCDKVSKCTVTVYPNH